MARKRVVVVAAVALCSVALAACSNRSDGAQSGGGGGGETSAGGATVKVASGDLGAMLVDAKGRTLYVFLADQGDRSTCYGDCASTWPALTTGGAPSADDGVASSALGTTERQDGATQVTIDGHPLYTFSGDKAAGDTNGQGIGDVWFVVAPDGSPIKQSGGGGGGRGY